MDSFTATFSLEKETKNTRKYQEDQGQGPPRIGSLYIQKWASEGAQKVKVTVEPI